MINSRDNGGSEKRRPYASYIAETYENGIFNNKLPIVTTDPKLLEGQARRAMGNKPFGYIYGGAGQMSSVDANRLVFDQWRIIPRVLKPSSPRDLRVRLFGSTYGNIPPVSTSFIYRIKTQQDWLIYL
jgi:hypothetical protein